MLVPDQRGYNLSDRPSGVAAYRIGTLAGDVRGLIGAAGYDSAHVIGHDWGGAVAWWLALHHPDRVRRLVVMNIPHPTVFRRTLRTRPAQAVRSLYAGFFQLPGLPERAIRAGNYRLLARMLRDSSRPGTFPADVLSRYRRAWARPGALTGMLNWYRAAARTRPTPRTDRVEVPTAILWGVRDRALLPEMARESLRYCPDGRLERFETATHWLHHEFPDRITDALPDVLPDA